MQLLEVYDASCAITLVQISPQKIKDQHLKEHQDSQLLFGHTGLSGDDSVRGARIWKVFGQGC